jgi:hypothetical protein
LKHRWPAGNTDFALYADFQGVKRTELYSALKSSPLAAQLDPLSPLQKRCVQAFLASARELAIASMGPRQLTLLHFDWQKLDVAPGACFTVALGHTRVELPAAQEAYKVGSQLALVDSGWIFLGSADAVMAAQAANSSEKAWPVALDLTAHRYVSFTFQIAGKGSGHGGLTISPEIFRFETRAQLAEEQLAVDTERQVRDLLTASNLAQTASSQPVKLERQGKSLLGFLEIRGGGAEQAQGLGAVSALILGNVRKYVQNAKKAEALNTVGEIAKRYTTSLGSALLAKSSKKLFSLPAVPKVIPSGEKYQSTRDEWQHWDKIGFFVADPQYYQYEVTTSQGGTLAEVVARGDLDGDGKRATFVLQLKLEGNEVLIAPTIQETDPDE